MDFTFELKKYGELFLVKKGFEELEKLDTAHLSFGIKMAIAKNMKIINNEIELFEELHKEPEGFAQYLNDYNELLMTMSKKDEQGNIIFKNEKKEVIIEDMPSFKTKADEIKEKYKDVIQERENVLKKRTEDLLTDLSDNLQLKKIGSNYLPYQLSLVSFTYMRYMQEFDIENIPTVELPMKYNDAVMLLQNMNDIAKKVIEHEDLSKYDVYDKLKLTFISIFNTLEIESEKKQKNEKTVYTIFPITYEEISKIDNLSLNQLNSISDLIIE